MQRHLTGRKAELSGLEKGSRWCEDERQFQEVFFQACMLALFVPTVVFDLLSSRDAASASANSGPV